MSNRNDKMLRCVPIKWLMAHVLRLSLPLSGEAISLKIVLFFMKIIAFTITLFSPDNLYISAEPRCNWSWNSCWKPTIRIYLHLCKQVWSHSKWYPTVMSLSDMVFGTTKNCNTLILYVSKLWDLSQSKNCPTMNEVNFSNYVLCKS